MLGPKKWGPFQVVTTANGVNVDFTNKQGQIRTQHYAFLVSEAEFDQIFARVKEGGLTHWADPARAKEGEINRHDGGPASISRTRAATCWKSSRCPTAAAVGNLKVGYCKFL